MRCWDSSASPRVKTQQRAQLAERKYDAAKRKRAENEEAERWKQAKLEAERTEAENRRRAAEDAKRQKVVNELLAQKVHRARVVNEFPQSPLVTMPPPPAAISGGSAAAARLRGSRRTGTGHGAAQLVATVLGAERSRRGIELSGAAAGAAVDIPAIVGGVVQRRLDASQRRAGQPLFWDLAVCSTSSWGCPLRRWAPGWRPAGVAHTELEAARGGSSTLRTAVDWLDVTGSDEDEGSEEASATARRTRVKLRSCDAVIYPLERPDDGARCGLRYWAEHAARLRTVYDGLHGRPAVPVVVVHDWDPAAPCPDFVAKLGLGKREDTPPTFVPIRGPVGADVQHSSKSLGVVVEWLAAKTSAFQGPAAKAAGPLRGGGGGVDGDGGGDAVAMPAQLAHPPAAKVLGEDLEAEEKYKALDQQHRAYFSKAPPTGTKRKHPGAVAPRKRLASGGQTSA